MEDREYSREELEQVIKILDEKGIITRDEWPSMDSASYGRGLYKTLVEKGIENIGYCEPALEGYTDYSGALFDTCVYDLTAAEEYMLKYILHSE